MVRYVVLVSTLALACGFGVAQPNCLGQPPSTSIADRESPKPLRFQLMVAELSRETWLTVGVATNHPAASSTTEAIGSAADRLFHGVDETAEWMAVSENSPVLQKLASLREKGLLKVLTHPTLITISGRPASLWIGGEFPYTTKSKDGISIEFKDYGTRFEILPLVATDGMLRLDLRVRVSELDRNNGVTVDGTSIPAIRVRDVSCTAKMKAGQVLLVVGMDQTRLAHTSSTQRIQDDEAKRPSNESKPRYEQLTTLILVRRLTKTVATDSVWGAE